MSDRSREPRERVRSLIDPEEVADLALRLGKIDSPAGDEEEIARFLGAWLEEEGIPWTPVGLIPDRPNILATIAGTGGGKSLLFNSHMDTSIERDDPRLRSPNDQIFHGAWRENGTIRGHGVMNDKGPMAAWMIACKAIRSSGLELRGDLLMTMVVGETGREPVAEFQGLDFAGKDLGARFLATHGGVADYVLVAESTGFGIGWVEAGKVFLRIAIFGDTSLYTPYVQPEVEGSALLRARHLLNAWEGWAASYTVKHSYECPGGAVQPRVSIGAIRSGVPYNITRTPEVCEVFVDARIAPGQSPRGILREVQDLLKSLKLNAKVEVFLYRPGFEANGEEVAPLINAVRVAHQAVFHNPPEALAGPVTSMWRDNNVWNEMGVPAAMYGPGGGTGGGGRSIEIEDLAAAAEVYALTALEVAL